jgi:hypothetical protein
MELAHHSIQGLASLVFHASDLFDVLFSSPSDMHGAGFSSGVYLSTDFI